MKIEDIRKLLHAQPFRPFNVYFADGARLSVKHEDFVALAPTGREMIVYQSSGDYQAVDVMLVTGLEVPVRNRTRKPQK